MTSKGIAKRLVRCSAVPDCFRDLRQYCEVHICHPKGRQIVPSIIPLQGIPLGAVRIFSLQEAVKVVQIFHASPSFHA